MRATLAVLLMGLPLACGAGPRTFPVDLEQELNGLDILVTPSPGSVTVVTLQNRSAARADCRGEFAGGFATPVTRNTRVAPGKSATLSYTLKDDIARLHVKVTCTPTKTDK